MKMRAYSDCMFGSTHYPLKTSLPVSNSRYLFTSVEYYVALKPYRHCCQCNCQRIFPMRSISETEAKQLYEKPV